jgi:hypothetical protein
MALPTTMKAIILHQTGSPQYNTAAQIKDLRLNLSQSVPVPFSSEVLIRIHAVAISPYEYNPSPPPINPHLTHT